MLKIVLFFIVFTFSVNAEGAVNDSQITDFPEVRKSDYMTDITEYLTRCLTYQVDRADSAFQEFIAELPMDFEIRVCFIWMVFVVINAFVMLCV